MFSPDDIARLKADIFFLLMVLCVQIVVFVGCILMRRRIGRKARERENAVGNVFADGTRPDAEETGDA